MKLVVQKEGKRGTELLPVEYLTPKEISAIVLTVFEQLCETNHPKYLRTLKEVKTIVDECADGWGIK